MLSFSFYCYHLYFIIREILQICTTYKKYFKTSLVKEDINNSISLHQMVNAKRIHYNFCKEHSKFKKTPSEQQELKWIFKTIELRHFLN